MKSLAIVIPAYKKTFLSQTLKSLTAQTCKDFTLYVGDDNSPYDLEGIVMQYYGEMDIVYKKFESNYGLNDLVAHWDRCVEMTVEPFIWFFSDDDIMEPKCVEQYLSLPVEIRKSYLIHTNTKKYDSQTSSVVLSKPYPTFQNAKEFLDNKISGVINSCMAVEFAFSRDLYIKCGGFVKYDLAWGADFITWLKFAENSSGIFSITNNESFVIWRASNENISPDYSPQTIKRKMVAWVENARDIKKFLLRRGFRPRFWYVKFVFGVMRRRIDVLNILTIWKITKMFICKVGFPIEALTCLLYLVIKRVSFTLGLIKVEHGTM